MKHMNNDSVSMCLCVYYCAFVQYMCVVDVYVLMYLFFCINTRDLETSSQSLKALLLKHARMSTGSNGEKVFNAKRTVT